MSIVVVGVDGGGTKTRAIVADEHGTQLGEAVGAGSAARPGEIESSAATIAAVIRQALEKCNLTDAALRVANIGVAGAATPAEREELRKALAEHQLAEEIVVHPDFRIALDDAFDEGPGVLLISGTGSAAFGRSPSGETARCGGWGPVCGDEGSGAWIGRRALSVVTASADGREPETALVGAVLTAAQVNEPRDLIAWAAQAEPAQFATLAPIVTKIAEGGDLRANAIISLAVEELVLHVRTLSRTLFADERAATPVALTGGMLKRGSTLRKRLEQRLRSAVPGAQVHAGDVDAARGAVRGALRHITTGVAG